MANGEIPFQTVLSNCQIRVQKVIREKVYLRVCGFVNSFEVNRVFLGGLWEFNVHNIKIQAMLSYIGMMLTEFRQIGFEILGRPSQEKNCGAAMTTVSNIVVTMVIG